MTRLFAALYVSEIWHSLWRDSGSLYAKTRAVVLYDRILTGGEHRIELNNKPLDDFIGEVTP